MKTSLNSASVVGFGLSLTLSIGQLEDSAKFFSFLHYILDVTIVNEYKYDII